MIEIDIVLCNWRMFKSYQDKMKKLAIIVLKIILFCFVVILFEECNSRQKSQVDVFNPIYYNSFIGSPVDKYMKILAETKGIPDEVRVDFPLEFQDGVTYLFDYINKDTVFVVSITGKRDFNQNERLKIKPEHDSLYGMLRHYELPLSIFKNDTIRNIGLSTYKFDTIRKYEYRHALYLRSLINSDE